LLRGPIPRFPEKCSETTAWRDTRLITCRFRGSSWLGSQILKPGMASPEMVVGDEEDHTDGRSGEDSISSEEESELASEDNETSSSGSSTDEEVSAEEDTIENVPPIANVSSHTLTSAALSTDLKTRLASFIPQLQQANATLETDPEAATKQVDHVDDEEEQYIEMDLGLGVLTAKPSSGKRGLKTTVSEDSKSSDESSDNDASATEDQVGAGTTQVGIVDKLKGVKRAKRNIEEVG
jgi:hypothetical protein